MAAPADVSTERPWVHPAVVAWSEHQSNRWEPGSIEVQKFKNKSKRWEPDNFEVLKCKDKPGVFRLTGLHPDGTAVIAKRCREATGLVERMIYEEILPRVPLPALRCYGFLKEPDGKFCWLFLEDAAGDFYSPQLADHRALAGRFLAETQLATLPIDLQARLPDRDLGYYLHLLRGCRTTLLEHLAGNSALSDEDASVLRKVVAKCDVLESRWSEIEKICAAMPRTLVHNDFAIKNLRIRNGATRPALLAFDWEHAGWGLPGADLAQFGSRVASPDLAVYWSVLKREQPHLDLRDVQAVAACGTLLRLVNGIHWAPVIRYEPEQESVRPKLHPKLPIYDALLVQALSALRWS